MSEFKTCVLEMGAIVAAGARAATVALLGGDQDGAEGAVTADATVDALYVDVERDLFQLVATQAPVARDLRMVMASLRVAQEIERSGDLVRSIAVRALRLPPPPFDELSFSTVDDLAGSSCDAFERSIGAYKTLDTLTAGEVIVADDIVDAHHERFLEGLYMSRSTPIAQLVDLTMIGRFYERIGDHAVVIAERVRFVSAGAMDPGDHDESGTIDGL